MFKNSEAMTAALDWLEAEIEKDRADAMDEEREACAQLAFATEVQSARLMESANTDLEKEYYRGRGLGAAHIAARIQRRGKQ